MITQTIVHTFACFLSGTTTVLFILYTILLVVIAESLSSGKNPLGIIVSEPFKTCFITSGEHRLFVVDFHQFSWYQLGVIQTYFCANIIPVICLHVYKTANVYTC